MRKPKLIWTMIDGEWAANPQDIIWVTELPVVPPAPVPVCEGLRRLRVTKDKNRIKALQRYHRIKNQHEGIMVCLEHK